MKRIESYNERNRHRVPDRNRESLLRLGLAFAVCFFLASTMPPALVAATLSSLLFLAAAVTANVALFRGEGLAPDHLSRWDEAAVLIALSILTSWLVDPEAVAAAVAAAGT